MSEENTKDAINSTPSEDDDINVLPDDIFNRKDISQKMAKVITTLPSADVSPLIIHGPWGSGKSIHAKRIIQTLKEAPYSNDVTAVYWDAAKSDYITDPLMAFVAHLYKSVPIEKEEEYRGNAIMLCLKALTSATGEMLNQVTASTTGVDLKEVAKVAKDTIDNDINQNNPAYAQFISFLEASKTEQNRIAAAELLIKTVANRKKLVIVVDELDRCRPDFALRMIENIKHLFSTIDDCRFILVLNKDTITASVSSFYGLSKNDAEYYISKYTKIEFQLPLFVPGIGQNCNLFYFNHLLKQETDGIIANNGLIASFVSIYSHYRNIHLREIEKVVKNIKLIATLYHDDLHASNHYLSLLLVVICFVQVSDNKLLASLLARTYKPSDVLNALGYKPQILDQQLHMDLYSFLSDIFCSYLDLGNHTHNFILDPGRKWREIFDNCQYFFVNCLQWSVLLH